MNQCNSVFFDKNFVVLVLLAFLLISCTSPQGSSSKHAIDEGLSQSQSSITNEISAQQYLAQAKNARSEQAITALFDASVAFVREENYTSALWLANQTLALTPTKPQQYSLTLIKAQCLLALNEIEHANLQLAKANTFVNDTSLQHQRQYYELVAVIQKKRHLNIKALDASMRVFALNLAATNDDIMQIWSELASLSQWQVDELVSLNPPLVAGWQQLLRYAHQFGDNQARFDRYLRLWQQAYPSHPGQVVLEHLKQPLLSEETSISNVAIILPLSGPQEVAGKVAQQGILAAYKQVESRALHFIDANTLDMSTLPEFFVTNKIDYVIGPLLKSHVDNYLAQPDINIPTLLLNRPTTSAIKSNQFVFSMRREDEAIQAATILSKQKFKHPMILSLQDNISQRIANAFIEQWQVINNEPPQIVFFAPNENMQDVLKMSLDVDLSQQRIDELEQRMQKPIKTELRNRRDIDMIYIIATPQETRLLKPYIDVNISPFATLIPIYASSLSHSVNVDASESRDLNGLIFTEMPWLLKSKLQDSELIQLSQTLWPDRSDSLQRIFAMGIDSLSLIDKLALMKQAPYIRHFGQTGILRVARDNIITRSLLWGSYQRGEALEIVME